MRNTVSITILTKAKVDGELWYSCHTNDQEVWKWLHSQSRRYWQPISGDSQFDIHGKLMTIMQLKFS